MKLNELVESYIEKTNSSKAFIATKMKISNETLRVWGKEEVNLLPCWRIKKLEKLFDVDIHKLMKKEKEK